MSVRTLPERLKLNRPMLHPALGTKTLLPGKVTPGTMVQPEGGNSNTNIDRCPGRAVGE